MPFHKPLMYNCTSGVEHRIRIFAQAFGRDLKNQYCWSSLIFLSLISLARYIRVRYEDLVDDTDKTLENIYSHIGLPWTEHVRFLQSMLKFKPKFQSSPFAKTIIFFVARKVIWSHTHAENVTGTNGHGYYNTFRWQGITKRKIK